MRSIVILFLVCIAYSIIRYVAFAPQNVTNLPVMIVNKGVSMAAAFCFAIAFCQQWRRKRGKTSGNEPAVWFRAGVFGAIVHIPMSVVILEPAYFQEFFQKSIDGKPQRMSFAGEAVFLFGALSIAGIYLLHRQGWNNLSRWKLSLATTGVLFGHVLTMGICRGLNINKSHAYLPPMWLLSLIGITVGIWWLVLSKPGPETKSVDAEKN